MDQFDLKYVRHVYEDKPPSHQYSGKIAEDKLNGFLTAVLRLGQIESLRIKQSKDGVSYSVNILKSE